MNTPHPLASFDSPLPGYDVVIPCYNRAHVVADAVRSVLRQDPAPERVIVVDDGSTDASAAVIAGLANRYPRVSAILLPRNGGASHARNAGAASTRAPWLAFLDSDDVWLPGAARALLRAGETRDVDVVVGHFARVEPGEQPGGPECGWDGGDIRGALATGGVVGPSWSMVRRATVFGVGGFDPSFHNCNDWDFYVRAGATGARFARIDDTVALYRTVIGARLVADVEIGRGNAGRILSHPYCAAPAN
ncbi:glycosyltransferase family 2 protein [Sphingomonas sp.]|uniref:glycosyltransferase family 2 protein n=1 Tax=Sphingomonas sp. TaxID=28214 RepID=UPI0035BBA835